MPIERTQPGAVRRSSRWPLWRVRIGPSVASTEGEIVGARGARHQRNQCRLVALAADAQGAVPAIPNTMSATFVSDASVTRNPFKFAAPQVLAVDALWVNTNRPTSEVRRAGHYQARREDRFLVPSTYLAASRAAVPRSSRQPGAASSTCVAIPTPAHLNKALISRALVRSASWDHGSMTLRPGGSTASRQSSWTRRHDGSSGVRSCLRRQP